MKKNLKEKNKMCIHGIAIDSPIPCECCAEGVKLWPNNHSFLLIDAIDKAKIRRGPGKYGIVTDMTTGKRFTVRGAECNSKGCWCAVDVTQI